MSTTTARLPVSEPRRVLPQSDEMVAALDSLAAYSDGWDSYRAPAPTPLAIANAKALVNAAFESGFACDRVEPSVMGGIGVTFGSRGRTVVVEFYNRGTAHALFADPADLNGMSTHAVPTTVAGYMSVIADARRYLDG